MDIGNSNAYLGLSFALTSTLLPPSQQLHLWNAETEAISSLAAAADQERLRLDNSPRFHFMHLQAAR